MASFIVNKPTSKYVKFHKIEVGSFFMFGKDEELFIKIEPIADKENIIFYNAISLVDFKSYEIDAADNVVVYDAELNLKHA
jgi:hypothetical protein